MRKAKASLITSVIIGLLAISTAGVSTYAWFRAAANINIGPVTSTTNITTTKPDDFSFWAYRGNGVDGYTPCSPEKFEYSGGSGDFEQITSGSPKTSLTGLGPGQQMLFAVKFSNVTSLTFDIKSIISNDSSKQGITTRKVAGSGNPGTLINIGWAIDIFSTESLDGTGYTTFLSSPGTDKFQVSAASNNGWVSPTGDANHVITYASNAYKNIFTKANATLRATYYVFYMVKFSDDTDTYYKEVSSDSGSASTLEFPTPGASARWFVKDNNSSDTDGNSNCYAGLDFAIKEIVVTRNGETMDQE